MGIRRVVTGHDANGKAVFASDEEVEPITLALLPGAEFFQLWGADAPRRFPDDGSAQAGQRFFPPVGGIRFGLFTVAPDSVSMLEDLDMDAAIRELNEKLPGVGDHCFTIRRVVTGHDANGKAVFASDEDVEPITLASEFITIGSSRPNNKIAGLRTGRQSRMTSPEMP